MSPKDDSEEMARFPKPLVENGVKRQAQNNNQQVPPATGDAQTSQFEPRFYSQPLIRVTCPSSVPIRRYGMGKNRGRQTAMKSYSNLHTRLPPNPRGRENFRFSCDEFEAVLEQRIQQSTSLGNSMSQPTTLTQSTRSVNSSPQLDNIHSPRVPSRSSPRLRRTSPAMASLTSTPMASPPSPVMASTSTAETEDAVSETTAETDAVSETIIQTKKKRKRQKKKDNEKKTESKRLKKNSNTFVNFMKHNKPSNLEVAKTFIKTLGRRNTTQSTSTARVSTPSPQINETSRGSSVEPESSKSGTRKQKAKTSHLSPGKIISKVSKSYVLISRPGTSAEPTPEPVCFQTVPQDTQVLATSLQPPEPPSSSAIPEIGSDTPTTVTAEDLQTGRSTLSQTGVPRPIIIPAGSLQNGGPASSQSQAGSQWTPIGSYELPAVTQIRAQKTGTITSVVGDPQIKIGSVPRATSPFVGQSQTGIEMAEGSLGSQDQIPGNLTSHRPSSLAGTLLNGPTQNAFSSSSSSVSRQNGSQLLRTRQKKHFTPFGPVEEEPKKKTQKDKAKKAFRNFQGIRNLVTRFGVCSSFDDFVHLNAIELMLIKAYNKIKDYENNELLDASDDDSSEQELNAVPVPYRSECSKENSTPLEPSTPLPPPPINLPQTESISLTSSNCVTVNERSTVEEVMDSEHGNILPEIRIRQGNELFSSDEEGPEGVATSSAYDETYKQLLRMGFCSVTEAKLRKIVQICKGNVELCIDTLVNSTL